MMDGFISKELSASVNVPAHVCIRESTDHKVILVIHGYGQTAAHFLDQVSGFLGNRSICGVQAPFPVPTKGASGMQVGYAWYAYDPRTNTFQIPISTGVDFICEVLGQLGLADKVQTIIGFSQGGYLAPFVGLRLSKTKQVIGINCRFKDEDLDRAQISFRLDAINSANDSIIDLEKARASHKRLLDLDCAGTFRVVPNSKHEFSPVLGQAVAETLTLA